MGSQPTEHNLIEGGKKMNEKKEQKQNNYWYMKIYLSLWNDTRNQSQPILMNWAKTHSMNVIICVFFYRLK